MQHYVIALYIRLSIEDSKYDSLSIQNQHLILNEFALSMPEAGNAELLEFVDNGFSGTNFERPEVQRLIEMVRENKIDCIIVKDFSRFGRNSLETGYFIERVFPLYHTRFISVSDDFDSDHFKGDTGGMDVAFKYLISEYYSRDMSIKTKSAKYTKMQRGEYQSKICPYGYRKSQDGRMEPDPDAAAIVGRIFDLAVGGLNAAQIAKELYRQGVPTPGEYKVATGNRTFDVSRTRGVWSNSTVLRILEDERYTGTYVIGKRAVLEVGGTHSRLKDREKWYIIPDHHPAIVDKAVFEQVQAATRRFSLPNKKQHDYPLKGKISCGCCDHSLSRVMQKTPFYHCRHSEADETLPCHNMRIGVDQLEQLVFDILRKQMEVLLGMGGSDLSALDADLARQTEYERQISAIQDTKRQLYEQYLMREIDLDDYKAQKAVCDAKLLQVKNTCAAVTAQAKQAQEQHAEQVKRKQIIQEISQAHGLTNSLVDLLIEKVYVFPEKRIEIAYKVSDFNA
jgi:site-specific DNA recombinase